MGLPCRASQVGILRLSGKRFEPSVRKNRKILIPTWVYSCCVRHEENRSENCRIVFPPMGVSRMGYGYCNIIYGQIRQKSLIFFCLSVIPFVTRPPPLLSSPMVETPALKEIFQKTQRGDHFWNVELFLSAPLHFFAVRFWQWAALKKPLSPSFSKSNTPI